MDVTVHKEFPDTSSYDVTLHSIIGDITETPQILFSNAFTAILRLPDRQFDYGKYGPHVFYADPQFHFDEAPSNPKLIEPCF